MFGNDSMKMLQSRLSELKGEEAKVNATVRELVAGTALIDFFAARDLKVRRCGLQSQIKNVESKIHPNIIA